MPSNLDRIRELFCYSISSKRYALFNLGENGYPLIRKISEHGLGHLLNPIDPGDTDRDWIRELWNYIICTDALGLEIKEPPWLNRPAISRETISNAELMRPFRQYNKTKPYDEQIKPFNFVLSAHVAPFGHPFGVVSEKFHLLAPYDSDPRHWLKMKWLNRYTGETYSITGSGEPIQGLVKIKTFRDVLNQYRVHSEAKSLGPDGELCSQATRGLLQRHPVEAAWITYMGKESNNLEQVQSGLIHDPDDVITEYCHKEHFFARRIVPELRRMPIRELMERSGLDRRTLQRIRAGKSMPSPQNRQKLTEIVERWLREAACKLS